jgi:hypothetical protein
MLQGGRERELDAFALLVPRVRAEEVGLEPELGVGERLEPDALGEPLGGPLVWIGRRRIVDREHAPGPLLDQAQAGVGRDPVEPGAKRASALEAGESTPGAQQRLLERVLGVGQ